MRGYNSYSSLFSRGETREFIQILRECGSSSRESFVKFDEDLLKCIFLDHRWHAKFDKAP